MGICNQLFMTDGRTVTIQLPNGNNLGQTQRKFIELSNFGKKNFKVSREGIDNNFIDFVNNILPLAI